MFDNIEVLTGDRAVAESQPTSEGRPVLRGRSPELLKKIAETAQIWGDAVHSGGVTGLRARTRLAEALTTSDFPILLGSVFDRELLAQYQQIAPIWQGFAMRTTVKDFRAKKLVDLLGGRAILDPVGEGAPYPQRAMSEAEYSITVGKRGARLGLTWEDLVNDDLDALRDAPNRLAQGARDTEDYLATSLLVNASGANTDFFKSDNGNAPTALALTADNLATAFTALATRVDSDGRPIDVTRGVVLQVPQALEMTALAILNATEVRTTDGSKVLIGGNNLRGKVTLVVNPWLTVIATDAKAATRWFLTPAPNASRPALAVGFLRGHEVPDLRVQSLAGTRVGGGAIDPMEGSFEFDDIAYRVRHVLGSATLDPKATYCSNGS